MFGRNFPPLNLILYFLFACQIFLPSLDPVVAVEGARLSTPSPPSSPEPHPTTSTRPTAQSTASNNNRKPAALTRSSTEALISSLQKATAQATSPFSSLLLPIRSDPVATSPANKSVIPEEMAESCSAADFNNNNSNEEKTKQRQKYSVDFLLLRSDVPNSKKLPSNWKALNEKFPTICFCGKVSWGDCSMLYRIILILIDSYKFI